MSVSYSVALIDGIAHDTLIVPKYVFWVDNYPKTASGKIQKFKLKEEGLKLVREGKGLR